MYAEEERGALSCAGGWEMRKYPGNNMNRGSDRNLFSLTVCIYVEYLLYQELEVNTL